jgi:hypothetical protein
LGVAERHEGVLVVALSNGQLEFNGYVLGDDVTTFTEEIAGWDDLPSVTSANAESPMTHGSIPGAKFVRERTITWSGRLVVPAGDATVELRAVRAALAPPPTEAEQTIRIRTLGEELIAYGHVTARALPGGVLLGRAGLGQLSAQWTCSDPRRYTPDSQTVAVTIPGGPGDGLEYPLDYPLDYGTATAPSGGTVTVAGDAPCPAVYTFTGPWEDPQLINATTARFMSFDITLAVGDVLVVDTRAGTVTLNGTADRLYTKTPDSSPMAELGLAPGVNSLTASGGAWSAPAGCSVTCPLGAFW